MDFFKGIGKLFTNKNQPNELARNPPSKLQGKMIKDYTFENQIVQFYNPQTQLVSGSRQDSSKVSIYALQKKLLDQQSFIAYQNNLANNFAGFYPQYLQHVQSANFIYIILEELHQPQNKSWMAEDFLTEIQEFAQKSKQKLQLDGLLVNSKKKLVYLPPYQDRRKITKFYYEGINKTVFAQLFCKVFQLPENDRQKIYDKILQFAGTKNLKSQVLKLFTSIQKNNNHNNQNSQNALVKKSFNHFGRENQINPKNIDSLYPDISAEDEEIMKLISVVKVNPKLFQNDSISNIRASTRARHQNQEQTKQIKIVIESATKSMFEINKVVKKSSVKSTFDNKDEREISDNKFEVYCTTYISIFQHFKRTVKSTLSFYEKGFSGIINAYFITLIGILRRSNLIYFLNRGTDIFQIGCQSSNVQFYTGKLKKELVSEAKILTDLREMILRCYIPMNTLEILLPFLDDHIEKIDLVKLEDFAFFYMTSLLKNNFQKNMHSINLIECMYIILHRNFEIVHFESDMPKGWNEDFFILRKCLIETMIPSWNI